MSIAKAGIVAVLLVLAAALNASAEVELTLRDGRVTIVATNATAGQILTEWARVGRTQIVNVERIPGGPQTLQLNDVPEAEALDLLLRSVTGYMAARRPVPAAHLSQYDRILVLPTAAVARVPVTTAPVFPQPVQRTPVDSDNDEGPSVPPQRGPLFPTFQATPPDVDEPLGGEPQPASTPFGRPGVASFPGAAAVGTPRPGMVVEPAEQPDPQAGQPVRVED